MCVHYIYLLLINSGVEHLLMPLLAIPSLSLMISLFRYLVLFGSMCFFIAGFLGSPYIGFSQCLTT